MGFWGVTMRQSDYGLDLLGTIEACCCGTVMILQMYKSISLCEISICFAVYTFCNQLWFSKVNASGLTGGVGLLGSIGFNKDV